MVELWPKGDIIFYRNSEYHPSVSFWRLPLGQGMTEHQTRWQHLQQHCPHQTIPWHPPNKTNPHTQKMAITQLIFMLEGQNFAW